VLDDLRQRLLPLLDELRAGVQKWSGVADYLRAPERDFGPLLADLKEITGRVADGEGVLGRLLPDDQMAADVGDIIARVRTASDQLEPILAQLEDTSVNAAAVARSIRAEAEDLPGLVARLQTALADAQAFVTELRSAGEDIPAITQATREAAERLPALILQAQAATRDIEKLAESLRKRFAPASTTPGPKGRFTPGEAMP